MKFLNYARLSIDLKMGLHSNRDTGEIRAHTQV